VHFGIDVICAKKHIPAAKGMQGFEKTSSAKQSRPGAPQGAARATLKIFSHQEAAKSVVGALLHPVKTFVCLPFKTVRNPLYSLTKRASTGQDRQGWNARWPTARQYFQGPVASKSAFWPRLMYPLRAQF
jgi:hypothetical protein